MIRRFLIVIFFHVLLVHANAQGPDDSLLNALEQLQQQQAGSSTVEEEYNTEAEEPESDTLLHIHPISILPDTVAAWKKQKAYGYMRNLDSLIKASERKEPEPEKERVTRQPSPFIGTWLKMILWGMAAIFVVVILFQLIKSKGFFKGSVTRSVEEEEVQQEEDILEQNFEKLVQQSEIQQDYRLATRYLFLKTLQMLKDKEHIDFSADKTNSRYVYEVPQQWRNDFSSLILKYEYVWYGKFALNEQQYQSVKNDFSHFNKKI